MILAIDQGTTGTTTVLYDKQGQFVDKEYKEFTQIYPQPGWVEHDPEEIWTTVVETVQKLCNRSKVIIDAIGITNQRETTIVWDPKTGKPVHNAIVWQCRRTTDICEDLKHHEELFRKKTGLPLDAYFSGTKIKWILDLVENKDVIVGTIDTWLVWKLTKGKVHATDYTNASRTLLFNIKSLEWDKELCEILNVPMNVLPEVKKSIDDYGVVTSINELNGVPIKAVAGDQQAALYGQGGVNKGDVKNTYGTGAFLLMNTETFVESKNGLITTIAVGKNGEPCYALEGAVFIAGAAIQWLRDEVGLLSNASESETMALEENDSAGVYLVPAFVGLGAPYWKPNARGALLGLTRGTNKNHIVRAALESMAYQTCDVLHLMEKESGIAIEELNVDGGAVANNFLCQFQADILNRPVIRPKIIESTSLGVAFMAGADMGSKEIDEEFVPNMNDDERRKLFSGWEKAVSQTIL
jgi:glycerol kinase